MPIPSRSPTSSAIRAPIALTALVVSLLAGRPATAGAQGTDARGTAGKQGAPVVHMSIDPRDGKFAEVCVSAEDRGDGVAKVELQVDGTRLSARPAAAVRNETGEECPASASVFDVELIPGVNRLEAIAYSSSGLASASVRDSVRGASDRSNTTLHVLTIGIDAYANPTMRLSYARNDARAFADSLARQSGALFQRVVIDSLFDEQATDGAIKAKFLEIAERMRENDTFVFFYAGHGSVASFGGTADVFYLVPVNVRDHTDGKALAMSGITAATLQQFLAYIPARSKLMVLDACNSGAVVNFFNRGSLGSAVLGTIRSEAQVGILAATQPSQPARESGAAGHGLFTAALLFNEAAPGSRARVQEIGDIAHAAGKAMPRLARQYGAVDQRPWMQPPPMDFPLIVR